MLACTLVQRRLLHVSGTRSCACHATQRPQPVRGNATQLHASAIAEAPPTPRRFDTADIFPSSSDEEEETAVQTAFHYNQLSITSRLRKGRIPRPRVVKSDAMTSAKLKTELAAHMDTPQVTCTGFKFAMEPKLIRMADGHNAVISRCLYFESPAPYAHQLLHDCTDDDESCPAFTVLED